MGLQVDHGPAGGILEVTRGSQWTSIGCVFDLIVEGVIRAVQADYQAPIGGRGPDGFDLPASAAIGQGGNGGNAWNRGDTVPGSSAFGNGGGGAASATTGGNAGANSGGVGATKPQIGSPQYWRIAGGGAGGSVGDPNGRPGGSINDNIGGGGAIGGGGGGGARGFHGGLLYLRVLGNVRLTGGVIDLSGQPGGQGGQGGSAHAPFNNDIRAGGGGGGGAGGNGGMLVLRHSGSYQAGQVLTGAGAGGAGGAPGTYSFKKTDPQAQSGQSAGAGNAGTFQVTKVPK